MNWILHFGLPPRFRKDVKIIQVLSMPISFDRVYMLHLYVFKVEICAEEFGNNVPAHIMLHGHIKAVLKQVRLYPMHPKLPCQKQTSFSQ